MTYPVHPAFTEARRIRDGVERMADGDGRIMADAMIDLVGDEMGTIAGGIIMIYREEANRMEAITCAFIAGLLIGRDAS